MPNARKVCAVDLPSRIFIGFSSDGKEIVATYGSQKEVNEFKQPDEIVSGPWMRVPARNRKKRPRAKATA